MEKFKKILNSEIGVYLIMFLWVLPLIVCAIGGALKDEFGMVELGNKIQIIALINLAVTHFLPFVAVFICAFFKVSKESKSDIFIVK